MTPRCKMTGRSRGRGRALALSPLLRIVSMGLAGTAIASAQTSAPQSGAPEKALSEALVAACRQNETQFAAYLTAENAAVFFKLPADQRTALMQRFVALDTAGRPLLSSTSDGQTVIRCETPSVTGEMKLGKTRGQENLAFVPVELLGGRQVDFGVVREAGGWKVLSVGLLLLDLPALSRQWEENETEASEEAAMASLRKLGEAVEAYRRAYGRLPESLAQMGPPPKEGVSPDRAALIDAELAAGQKGGYGFRYVIRPAAGEGAPPAFELAATPIAYSKQARRSFLLDAAGTLRGGDKHGQVASAADSRIESRKIP